MVAGVVAQGSGEVYRPGAAQRADREVAQARHDLRASPGAQLGGVLGEGHIADPVQAVLDRPVSAQEIGEPGGAGLSVGQAGDRVDDHSPPPLGAKLTGLAGDLDDLRGMREPKWCTVTALRVRGSTRPCARSGVRFKTGTRCQASRAQRPRRVGWLALTVNR